MNSDAQRAALMGINELSVSLNARLLSYSDKNAFPFFSSVSIDSRTVEEGGLFFAFKGESCDGHAFTEAAFKAGARAAVVEESKLKNFNLTEIAKSAGRDLIVVSDTLKTLQEASRLYLEKFPKLQKIGITGSCGKTTTKEIAFAIISAEKNTVMSKGNYNSCFGLPLSLFNIRPCHETGIFEIGISNTGEMSSLAGLLKPNIALITNIGIAHIANFGTKDVLLNEKKQIFKFLKDNDTALIPKDDECSSELAKGINGKVSFYCRESFKELEGVKSLGLDGYEIIWAGEKICYALPGEQSLENAIASIAIAKEAGVSDNAVKKGLESVKPLFGRLEVLKGRTTVLRDCYNANPRSTAKSIELCDSLDWPARRVYVIADMLELGNASVEAHEEIGKILAGSKAQKVFLFGAEVKAAEDILKGSAKEFFYTNDVNELSCALGRYVQSGDLVLLKGSRGCALERLTCLLIGKNTEVTSVS